MRRTSRSASDDSRTLPEATQWSGVARPGPVADGDEVRAVGLGDGQQRVAVEDAEPGRLVGQARQPLELGQRDPAQVERPLGALGEADDDQAEPVLAGLVVLLDEAALLERGEQPRRGRLVQARAGGRAR